MPITGAEILLEALKREGVECIFGYPGGANIPIYDALYNSPIKHILTRHEQGAVFAAGGGVFAAKVAQIVLGTAAIALAGILGALALAESAL